ncbi:MAG: 3-hydroxyacyl-CoA dehydrogenase [Acetobacteraceae bacterium]|nr:3-hydroxyacyl-CoA dehydrogenase [Acetobacteraceae bacterium]
MTQVAIIGGGFIGRAWSIVFARAGMQVALWDPDAAASGAAKDFIAARLPELRAAGLLDDEPEAVLARIAVAASLEAAVEGAVHVQENGPENVEGKRESFARLDKLVPPGVPLASSTSGIPASAFTEKLGGRHRCLVAHPVNPPYLVPLVELCPSPWTEDEVVGRSAALMRDAGMAPVRLRREVAGFALNRLQIALVSEAFRLVAHGVMSLEDVDATVKHGLGLRWSFMGPFETIDLNAPGGLSDYIDRYGKLYEQVEDEMTPIAFTTELVDDLQDARRELLPMDKHAERQAWRDRRLMALLAHKKGQPE